MLYYYNSWYSPERFSYTKNKSEGYIFFIFYFLKARFSEWEEIYTPHLIPKDIKISISYHVILTSSFPLGGDRALEIRTSLVFSAILQA